MRDGISSILTSQFLFAMFNRIVVTKRTRNRLTVLHESQTYGVLNERVPNPKLRQSSIEMHLQDNINMDITIDQVFIYGCSQTTRCYFRQMYKGYSKCMIVYMGIAISNPLMLIKPKYLFLKREEGYHKTVDGCIMGTKLKL